MIAVLKFPGTNCHLDVVSAYERMGSCCVIVDHSDTSLPSGVTLAVLPGGFSYGDYLRCGVIAAKSSIMLGLRKYVDNGGFVLGICNGFQILCESGILPGVLIRNQNLSFVSRNARVIVCSTDNVMFRDYQEGSVVNLPVAHGEGNYRIDPESLDTLNSNGQVVLRYETDVNGSVDNIAGICNETKNVFGIMPHPERAINVKSINSFAPDFSSLNMDGFLMLSSFLDVRLA